MANKLELTWYGKDEPIRVEPRLLIENVALSNTAADPDTQNMLIHGDNLLALKALESKFAGQVKCIYIDPPYNTGSAFEHYDDNLEHSQLLFFLAPLVFCFFHEDLFTVNQMTFFGVFGASIISIFTISISLNQEKRSAYLTARRSALLLSNILDSLYSQIEQISNGLVHPIAYPLDWIHYYEQCCTYLQYNYLPYLLREFDIVEKLNQCILSNDKTGIERYFMHLAIYGHIRVNQLVR